MANLITTIRLLLLFVLAGITWIPGLAMQVLALALVIVIFVLDGIDGVVARRRGETSLFGAVYDIAADRVVEIVLWVILAHAGRVPLIVPIIFIVRGGLVDSLRALATAQGHEPFSAANSAIGRFLVAGRFMRGLYGTVKTLAFAWLYFVPIVETAAPAIARAHGALLDGVGGVLVFAATALCLIRGVPVVIDVMRAQGVGPFRDRSP